jgi:hypothetical protein
MENISKEAELDNFKHQSYERMAATYPLIYRAYLHPDQYPAYPIAERKFECGLGWYDIIDELSADWESENTACGSVQREIWLTSLLRS